jgi:hypothetical protein
MPAARLAYMKPAPPVTRMFFASSSASNLVLPTKIGACFDSSSATYDRGFSMVEFRRAGSRLVFGEVYLHIWWGHTLDAVGTIWRGLQRFRTLDGRHCGMAICRSDT